MSESQYPAYRPEFKTYLRASQQLLQVGVNIPNSPRFSQEERDQMEYYLAEVGKILAVGPMK